MSDVAAGTLLVATPTLHDPNFAGTVVLLLDVGDDGALGVVVNRTSPVPVAEVLQPWADHASEPAVLHRGGPVGTDGALAVGRLAAGQEPPPGWRTVFADVGLVDLDGPPEVIAPALVDLRIFAGYAGWGAEQLADEIAEGAWYVVPGSARDAFVEDHEALWRAVLRRQAGELAWLSTRPADPEMN